MIHRRATCVVFDLDDTLYLERDYVKSGFAFVGRWASRWLGITDFAERAWQLFEEGNRRDIFNQVLERAGIGETAPAIIPELLSLYRTHPPDIHLLEDSIECLSQLRGSVRMALVTDGPLTSQSAKVEALGLSSYTDPLVLTDTWGVEYRKPHHRAFEHVQTLTSQTCNQWFYIADNPYKDFQAPSALGWTTIRVRRPGSLHETVPDSCIPSFTVTDLSGIPAIAASEFPIPAQVSASFK